MLLLLSPPQLHFNSSWVSHENEFHNTPPIPSKKKLNGNLEDPPGEHLLTKKHLNF